MEGRWRLALEVDGEAWMTTADDDGADLPDGMTLVPVVPCDDSAIERGARTLHALVRDDEGDWVTHLSPAGRQRWRNIVVEVLRAAGETP